MTENQGAPGGPPPAPFDAEPDEARQQAPAPSGGGGATPFGDGGSIPLEMDTSGALDNGSIPLEMDTSAAPPSPVPQNN